MEWKNLLNLLTRAENTSKIKAFRVFENLTKISPVREFAHQHRRGDGTGASLYIGVVTVSFPLIWTVVSSGRFSWAEQLTADLELWAYVLYVWILAWSLYGDNKAKYDKVTAKGIHRRKLERFIRAVEKLPAMVTEFDEALWGSLVDHLTVNAKDDIVFTLTSGMEIKA